MSQYVIVYQMATLTTVKELGPDAWVSSAE